MRGNEHNTLAMYYDVIFRNLIDDFEIELNKIIIWFLKYSSAVRRMFADIQNLIAAYLVMSNYRKRLFRSEFRLRFDVRGDDELRNAIVVYVGIVITHTQTWVIVTC